MNTLVHSSFTLRRNIPMLIGAFLCLYFSYHVVQGHRSLPSFISLEYEITDKKAELEALRAERMDLESKVVMLRPGSLNRDFLEERARFMLGYRHPDEWIVINRSL